jgi:hypothetical protein
MRTLWLAAVAALPMFAQPSNVSSFIAAAHQRSAQSASAQMEVLDRLGATDSPGGPISIHTAGPSGETFGRQMPMYTVPLDRLMEFDQIPNVNAVQALSDMERVFYPIQVSGRTVSGVDMVKRDGVWVSSRLGGTEFATLIDAAISKLHLQETAIILVEIPALRLQCIGFEKNGVLMLAPTESVPAFEFRAGVAEPARSVFLRLAPWARTHSGDPT